MPDWRILSCTVSGQGDPIQCHDENGEEVFVCIAAREGGPDDSIMPRRAIGTGSVRMSAMRSLVDAMSRHDPSGRMLPSR